MSSLTHLRIATRLSPLALWQANYARSKLLAHWPHLQIDLLPMKTSGDRFLQSKLLDIGGKRLFVKELEEALLNHQADLAVHSMKDVPSEIPDKLTLETIFARENPLDAFVSNQYPTLESLPSGAIVGTSSLRRASQLLALRPDLNIQSIRGNVGSRLKKLDNGDYDGIILAAAGLKRLQLDTRIRVILPPQTMLPAPGQGALGIECRADDEALKSLLAPLHDPFSATTVGVERLVNQKLGGNCHTPVAIYCRYTEKNQIQLDTLVACASGAKMIRDSQIGPDKNAVYLAHQSANALLARGAQELLNHHASPF